MTRLLALLGFVVLAACGASGAETGNSDTSAPAESSTSTVARESGIQPQGFSTITARVTKVNGEICDVCLWLADSADERGRGLMGVTDLGEPDGMAFLFDEAKSGTFFMSQTPTSLPIAWFDVDGSVVGIRDMAPCLDTPRADCPRYSPGSTYQLAVETFEGGLSSLGVGDGSSVHLLTETESPTCQLTT